MPPLLHWLAAVINRPKRLENLLRELKRLNNDVSNLEAMLGVSTTQSIPPHLEVDFSSKCNLRCPMCHQSKIDMGNYSLGDEQINTLIDSLPFISTIMIAGLGEPLLFPRLEEFVVYASRYGCWIHLFTNGQLIHRRLPLFRHLHRISISLDGATAATFEKLRHGAQFDRVCNNIRLLRHVAPHTEIVTSTVVSRTNVLEVAAIAELANTLAMDEVHFSPVDHTPDLALRPCDSEPYFSQLEQAKDVGIRIINNIRPSHFNAGRNSMIRESDRLLIKSLDTASSPIGDAFECLHPLQFQSSLIHGMKGREEVRKLKNRISVLRRHRVELQESVKRNDTRLRLPFCSVPWKYSFAQSNGQARLCPYTEISVGSIGMLLGGRYNSPLLESVRDSMSRTAPNLQVCRDCTDDHRHFQLAIIGRHNDPAVVRIEVKNSSKK